MTVCSYTLLTLFVYKNRAALLRAAKRMRDDGWWNLGTAEKPITSASIGQAMGKEMAYHTVMKTVREGLLGEILCLPRCVFANHHIPPLRLPIRD